MFTPLFLLRLREKVMNKMNNSLAIAVLCSRLCSDNCRPLEASEWSKLADLMIKQNILPKDIPDFSDDDMKRYFGYETVEIERIKKLLRRAGELSIELEKLSSIGINVVTRADSDYPKMLKAKLKGGCPPMFYYAGDLSLLNRKTVGFVGSRTVDEEDIAFTQRIVEKVNSRGFGVVSGGAKGTDTAASAASLSNGSFCIEYICDSFIQRIKKKEVISRIQNKSLLIMSKAKPDAAFNTGMAMERNKYIYVQSEAAVVIKSDYNKGGTWSGAIDALKKGYCPVFCRSSKEYLGNTELISRGAIPIDDTWDGNVENVPTSTSDEGEQLSFFD